MIKAAALMKNPIMPNIIQAQNAQAITFFVHFPNLVNSNIMAMTPNIARAIIENKVGLI